VLSGQGLSELYAWLVAGDPLPPAEVQRRAEAGDAPAVGAVRHFVRILVRHLGDLALQFNPGAGLYLCGGVAVHLADWIARGFDAGFTDKGRMRPWLERIPVRLVEDFDIGLQGAIRIAREVADGSA
jgi:glucokinase